MFRDRYRHPSQHLVLKNTFDSLWAHEEQRGAPSLVVGGHSSAQDMRALVHPAAWVDIQLDLHRKPRQPIVQRNGKDGIVKCKRIW